MPGARDKFATSLYFIRKLHIYNGYKKLFHTFELFIVLKNQTLTCLNRNIHTFPILSSLPTPGNLPLSRTPPSNDALRVVLTFHPDLHEYAFVDPACNAANLKRYLENLLPSEFKPYFLEYLQWVWKVFAVLKFAGFPLFTFNFISQATSFQPIPFTRRTKNIRKIWIIVPTS